MPIIFQCPSCFSRLRISARKAGTEVDCPRCAVRVRVPGPVASAWAPDPAPSPAVPPPTLSPPPLPVPPTGRATPTAEDKTITLKCLSCGGNLDITADMDSFACGYCGTRQVVQRRGGTVSLSLIGKAIARVQVGTDRTAAELAVRRLRGDLATLERERKEYEQQMAEERGVAGCMVGCLSVIGLFAALVLVANGAGGIILGLGIMGLLTVMVIGAIENFRKIRERREEARRRFAARQNEIESEIAEHLELLNRRGPNL